MSQNIPVNRMVDPTPRPTLRQTTRTPQPQGTVPLSTDFTEHLQEGGYPDFEQAGLDFAAMQRAQARSTDNRVAATTGAATAGEISPGSGTQPAANGIASPPASK
jgi:hypothetical protein